MARTGVYKSIFDASENDGDSKFSVQREQNKRFNYKSINDQCVEGESCLNEIV